MSCIIRLKVLILPSNLTSIFPLNGVAIHVMFQFVWSSLSITAVNCIRSPMFSVLYYKIFPHWVGKATGKSTRDMKVGTGLNLRFAT